MKNLIALVGLVILAGQVLIWLPASAIPVFKMFPLLILAPLSGLSFVLVILASSPSGRD